MFTFIRCLVFCYLLFESFFCFNRLFVLSLSCFIILIKGCAVIEFNDGNHGGLS